MDGLKMIFDNWLTLEDHLKDTVGKLNRMIEQHPESSSFLSWVTLKEWIEKELLGYEVTVKS